MKKFFSSALFVLSLLLIAFEIVFAVDSFIEIKQERELLALYKASGADYMGVLFAEGLVFVSSLASTILGSVFTLICSKLTDKRGMRIASYVLLVSFVLSFFVIQIILAM